MKRSIVALLPLLCVMANPAFSDYSSASEESPALKGSLGLQTRQVDKETFEVRVEIDLQGIVAAIVHVPGEEQDLVRITAEGAEEVIESALRPRPALAMMSLGLPTLAGTISQRLSYDSTKLGAIEVILVTQQGEVIPSSFTSSGLGAGERFALSFGRPDCYNVSGQCLCDENSQNCSCSKTIECCTFPPNPCFDCDKCELTCGPCAQPS